MRESFVNRALRRVEIVGNALPHPGTIFLGLSVLTIALSWIFSAASWSVVHPVTGESIEAHNLANREGLHRILTHLVTNFTSFAPLGTVLVAMLGIGIAESSGLIGAFLRFVVISAPPRLLTIAVVLTGVLSNAASEVGYVLVVPLGAVVFASVGRHPIAGLASAFAGVSGGFSANLILGTVDPLLAGISEEAAQILRPDYTVNPACNWYFMIASTFLITFGGTWVTERLVEPRLGPYRGKSDEAIEPLLPKERKGLRDAGLVLLLFAVFLVWGGLDSVLPGDGFLRNPETGALDSKSTLLRGVVAFVFLSATFSSIAYGLRTGSIRSDTDVINGMGKALSGLGTYLVLVFFAAQFVAYFKWTNIGIIVAIEGARALSPLKEQPVLLMTGFILVSAVINIVMGSASAKWSIMAPIFVPMFMLLGFSPELAQAAFRIGDSATNIISPTMAYFALIVAFMERYQKDSGIGTVVATMLPYTFAFLIMWTALLAIWIGADLPLGPGSRLHLDG